MKKPFAPIKIFNIYVYISLDCAVEMQKYPVIHLVLRFDDVLQHVDVDLLDDALDLDGLDVRDPVQDLDLALDVAGEEGAVASVAEQGQGRERGDAAKLSTHPLLFGHDELDADVVDVVVDVLEAGHDPRRPLFAVGSVLFGAFADEQDRHERKRVDDVVEDL